MRKKNSSKLDDMFIERWSPRAFLSEPVAEENIKTIFEAARWSPSCFNEQPWRFVYAHQSEDLERFRSVLVEGNQVWANTAPLLVLVFSKKSFTQNDKPNRWTDFDTGASWMALSLQANKLGFYTHGMGGFDTEKAYAATGINPDEFNAICAIAIGKLGDADTLPGNLKEGETPSERMSLNEIMFEGSVKS